MSEEFLNYLNYIGFIDENTIPSFISIYNTPSELDKENQKEKNKTKIINSMIQYIKSLTDEQILGVMTKIYERYKENKIKIESKKLLNLIRIYNNKEIKFYFIYWNKLSQYLKHKEIQLYQQQLGSIKIENKSNNSNNLNNNSNFINGDYLESMTVTNNNSNKNNFIPNNISMIKVRNSDAYTTNNNNIRTRPKIPSNNFIQRQEKYMQLKKQNLMKNIDNNEEEFQLLYTFKPCLADSTKSYYYGNNYNGASLREAKKNRNINLYSNKMHDLRMKNLRQTVDNERGLTFKPRINSYKSVSNLYKKNNFDY